jgi:hypothetical protein
MGGRWWNQVFAVPIQTADTTVCLIFGKVPANRQEVPDFPARGFWDFMVNWREDATRNRVRGFTLPETVV